jgi:hypothetical protein
MTENVTKTTTDPLQPAVAALIEAESRLRETAAKVAGAGDYDNLVVITRWAKVLQSLAAEAAGGATDQAVIGSSPSGQVASRTAPHSRASRSDSRKTIPGVPVYSRDSDMLVKTARSRKSRNDYEHRAPADVVFTVAECLSAWRPNKKLLTGDQLLDSYAKRKGSVISYQVYASLGWFAQMGLVKRHGRSGYSVPRPTTIVEEVQKAWTALPGQVG